MSLPFLRKVFTTVTDFFPLLKVALLKELVVSPCVIVVVPTVNAVSPFFNLVLLLETAVRPHEMAFLLLSSFIFPFIKEVFLNKIDAFSPDLFPVVSSWMFVSSLSLTFLPNFDNVLFIPAVVVLVAI